MSATSSRLVLRGGAAAPLLRPSSTPCLGYSPLSLPMRLLSSLSTCPTCSKPPTQCRRRPSRASSRPFLPSRRSKSVMQNLRELLVSENVKHLMLEDGKWVIRKYEHLPKDYVDENGLPFRGDHLDLAEIQRIFGRRMSLSEGNMLLRILHGRRVAGTLDHPEFFHNTARFTDLEIQLGLTYLRETLPVDELLNASLRAGEELAEIEGQEKMGKFVSKPKQKEKVKWVKGSTKDVPKASTKPSQAQAPIPIPPTTAATPPTKKSRKSRKAAEKKDDQVKVKETPYVPDPVYGYSPMDELRHQKAEEAKKMAPLREARRKEKLISLGVEPEKVGTLMALDPNKVHVRPVLEQEPSENMKEYKKKAQSGLKEPPKMSPLWRFGPSLVFSITFLAVVAWLNSMYVPPKQHQRIFPDVPVALPPVLAIVGLNLLVWASWMIPPWWGAMNQRFILSFGLPSPAQMVLSTVSHHSMAHMLPNLLLLGMVGIPLCDAAGRADYLSLAAATGVAGSVAAMTWHGMIARNLGITSHGASSMALGTVAAYLWINRRETFGISRETIPQLSGDYGLSGWFILACILLKNALGFHPRLKDKGVDYANHWGGLLTGLGGGVWIEHRMKAKKQRRIQIAEAARVREECMMNRSKGGRLVANGVIIPGDDVVVNMTD